MVRAFGGVDILINNAGVGGGGPFERWNDKGWDWTVGVNLMSVIYGFDIFGRIMAQQGAGHIVSTASIAGMMPLDSSAYSATKFGVVAVSESLREELAPKGVGVSLLCPGFVNTNIIHSHRHLPERFGENLSDGDEVPVDDAALERIKTISDLIRTGHDPSFVGDLVCDGILNNHPYIFTDREHEPTIRARFEGILAASMSGFSRHHLIGLQTVASLSGSNQRSRVQPSYAECVRTRYTFFTGSCTSHVQLQPRGHHETIAGFIGFDPAFVVVHIDDAFDQINHAHRKARRARGACLARTPKRRHPTLLSGPHSSFCPALSGRH